MLEGEDTDTLTGETLFKDDQIVESVTSAAYGHMVGRSLAIALTSVVSAR